ncbi:hypothetical protein MMC29_006334 [Sticta canariensis]|nr:hypothetical protein [Sticta canariensis]
MDRAEFRASYNEAIKELEFQELFTAVVEWNNAQDNYLRLVRADRYPWGFPPEGNPLNDSPSPEIDNFSEVENPPFNSNDSSGSLYLVVSKEFASHCSPSGQEFYNSGQEEGDEEDPRDFQTNFPTRTILNERREEEPEVAGPPKKPKRLIKRILIKIESLLTAQRKSKFERLKSDWSLCCKH